MSPEHMLPMQWFPLVDPTSDLPSEPRGYIKMNCIINTLNERGAVQLRAPDDVGDWELVQKKILQIPRLNLRKVACHQYNLKFFVYQGFDLGTGAQLTADPVFRVMTPHTIISSDAFPNSLKPQWNTMLQVPFYEPAFCDLIYCQVLDGQHKVLSNLIFSWKDIFVRQNDFKQPRWIDMYERKDDFLKSTTLPLMDQSLASMLEQNAGISTSNGFEEASVYCGRVLLSMEIEERTFAKEPSPAQIALKPKDCVDMWSNAKQKMVSFRPCM